MGRTEPLGGPVQIPRPTQDDKDYFGSLLPEEPDVEIKPMFGNVGAFVNGNMFSGLFGSDVGVRLTDPEHRDELAAAGAGPFGPTERPMGGYLSLPPSWREEEGTPTAREWVARAYRQIGDLPPKARRAKKATPSQAGPRATR